MVLGISEDNEMLFTGVLYLWWRSIVGIGTDWWRPPLLPGVAVVLALAHGMIANGMPSKGPKCACLLGSAHAHRSLEPWDHYTKKSVPIGWKIRPSQQGQAVPVKMPQTNQPDNQQMCKVKLFWTLQPSQNHQQACREKPCWPRLGDEPSSPQNHEK